MVHKKYTYKDGKKFGPYYYETKRVDGKVVTRYLGTHLPRHSIHKKSKRTLFPVFILIGLAFVMMLVGFGYYFFGDNINDILIGRSILEVDADYSGESVTGNAYITLSQGELIPADSIVRISYGEETREIPLASLITEETRNGKFYVSGAELEGSGAGFGIPGQKVIEEVDFKFRVYDSGASESGSNSGGDGASSEGSGEAANEVNEEDESGGESSQNLTEFEDSEEVVSGDISQPSDEQANEEQTEEIQGQSSEEQNSEQDVEGSGSEESSSESSESDSESSGLTGSAIYENEQIIEVHLFTGENYSYPLEGKQAELVSGSVYSGQENLDDDLVEFQTTDEVVYASFFGKTESGFGLDYLGDDLMKVEFNLAELGLVVIDGAEIEISIIYNSFKIVSSRDLGQPVEEITDNNVTLNTTQFGAVLGQPVQWVKTVSADRDLLVAVELPASAENISIKTVSDGTESPESEKLEEEQLVESEKATNQGSSEETEELPHAIVDISGNVVLETGDFSFLKAFKKFVATGFVAVDLPEVETLEVEVNLSGGESVEISYSTPAPYATEEELGRGKRVVLSSPDDVHYENVLAFTELNDSLGIRGNSNLMIYWEENGTYLGLYSSSDRNGDGNIDYIEWIAPHLSNQTFEIIVITAAEHLDENKTFVSDVYESVRELDNNWSETIPGGHYVRVRFEHKLTSDRDITIYPRIVNGTPIIQVYEVNGTSLITQFDGIESGEYNKVYLDNLQGEQDSFDLLVLNGDIEFDHIIDPVIISNRHGLLVYGEGNIVTPRYRVWNGTAFGTEMSAAPASGCLAGTCNIITQRIASSPTRNEYAVMTSLGWTAGIFYNITLSLQFNSSLSGTNCWHNSTACNSSFNLRMINTTTPHVLRYSQLGDVKYEGLSGDALVTYLQGNQTILYRTWNGATLSSPIEVTQTALGGFIREVKLLPNPVGGDEIALAYRNHTAYSAMIWNGTEWTCKQTIPFTTNVATTNYTAMDLAYEQLSGDLFIAVANSGRNAINYTVKLNNSCTFTTAGAVTVGGTVTLTGVALSSQLNSNFILLGFHAALTADDTRAAFWNGTNITVYSTADTSSYATDAAGNMFIGVGWAGTDPRGVMAYSDAATNLNLTYRTYSTTSNTWSSQFATNASMITPFSDEEVWFKLYSFVEQNRTLAFIADDSTADLWAKIYNPATTNNWTNADGGTALETTGSAADQPHFDFTWNMYNPLFDIGLPVVTIVFPTNTTYSHQNLPLVFNVSLDEKGGTVMYSLDGGVNNFSMSSLNGINYNASNSSLAHGSYTFRVYANDTGGNRNDSASVVFSFASTPSLNFTFPTPANASSQTSNAIYVNVSSSDVVGHYVVLDFERDLRLWMRFNDVNSTGAPVDLSSWSNNGSLINGALINSTGYWSNGSSYDGTNDYTRIPDSDSLDMGVSNFTLAAWVKTNPISDYKIVIGKGSSGTVGYSMSLEPSGKIDFGIETATTNAHFTSNNEVDDGNWHHIAVTAARFGDVTFYIDGAPNGTSTIRIHNQSVNNTVALAIGELGLGSFFFFNGSIDEPMVFARHLSTAEIKAIYNASANQYSNNFSNLPSATYRFTGYAVNSYGNKNETETRVVTISGNTAPFMNQSILRINASTGLNRTHEDLNCFGVLMDNESNTINVSVRWYNDTTQRLQVDYNNSYAAGTAFNAILDDGNTTKGQNWSCAMNLFDGALYSGWFNSTTPANITILNSPPTVPVLSSPADSSATTDRTPTFSWSAGVDNDTDTVSYELNVTLVALSTCVDPSRHITSISGTSHELAQDLNCFYDNGDIYNWTVRAYDSQDYSSWYAPPYRLNITAVIGITLLNSTVDFGSINFLESNDTVDNSPRPFLLQSDGNALVNVTIQATSLWTASANPNIYYRFKIDNNTLENNSFRWGSSVTSFTNMPLVGSPTIAIGYLNYTDVTDTAEIDIFIQVPPNEGAGARNSTVTLISVLT